MVLLTLVIVTPQVAIPGSVTYRRTMPEMASALTAVIVIDEPRLGVDVDAAIANAFISTFTDDETVYVPSVALTVPL